jgi:hypothetical protein
VTCPTCRRPVAVLRSGLCSYCGAVVGPVDRSAARASSIPPEVLIALEPRTHDSGSKWLRRTVALGAAGVLLAVFIKACMKA